MLSVSSDSVGRRDLCRRRVDPPADACRREAPRDQAPRFASTLRKAGFRALDQQVDIATLTEDDAELTGSSTASSRRRRSSRTPGAPRSLRRWRGAGHAGVHGGNGHGLGGHRHRLGDRHRHRRRRPHRARRAPARRAAARPEPARPEPAREGNEHHGHRHDRHRHDRHRHDRHRHHGFGSATSPRSGEPQSPTGRSTSSRARCDGSACARCDAARSVLACGLVAGCIGGHRRGAFLLPCPPPPPAAATGGPSRSTRSLTRPQHRQTGRQHSRAAKRIRHATGRP